MITGNYASIPAELKLLPNWVCWRFKAREGRLTKVPYRPDGIKASVSDPATWETFDACVQATGFHGIGFTLSPPYVGADLDHCRDRSTGEVKEWALAIVSRLSSYTEVSPSGRGVHILVKGDLPAGRRREGNVEMYAAGRYFTVTGNHLDGTPLTVEDRSGELLVIHAELFPPPVAPERVASRPATTLLADDELVRKASTAANGTRFNALWRGEWQSLGFPSQSEADGALCCMLAFWCGGDESRVDSLFRQSGLMREKWNREQYRSRTIGYAVSRVASFYTPTT